ncbi:DUF2807 domain-containing protein [Candidatus Synchoanobacter obligatus]|uniref:DUF2807 domain-containing protein n=1 Tax=Candidatus Synchoanobacter obligatus TaxID=2919597 RepID=A0ABT1L4J9_9GAMM|nr:DUF2807 domain-containing protein [Candidatus Synchoanobacter obligatus]MCP8352102.1 DUF2807 domain-containing protein [Candidatus Synchoanobacter obligatus]
MFARLLMACFSLATNAVLAQDSLMDAEEFVPYSNARQLVVRGNVNVIMGGDSYLNVIEFDPDEVSIKTLPGDVIEVSPVSLGRHYNMFSNPTVVVRSNNRFRDLYKIHIRDQGSLVAKDIESLSLAIDVKTTGSVMVEGVMNLNHLQVVSASDVEIYWVDSNNLNVDVFDGNVVLAGRVDFLTMRATDSASVDAAGLIANRSWVAGVGNARLAVFPREELFAYTKNNAVIDVKSRPDVYAPLNQAPSSIVLNYVEMEKRASAIRR